MSALNLCVSEMTPSPDDYEFGPNVPGADIPLWSCRRDKREREYNGWGSWEEWNVNLWLNGDEETYRAARRCSDPEDLADLAEFLRHRWPSMAERQNGHEFAVIYTPDGAPVTADNLSEAVELALEN